MSTRNPRRLTIDAKGEVGPAPYGVGRWSSPRTYTCAHQDCPNPATLLKTADAHPAQVAKTHNCCGDHNTQP